MRSDISKKSYIRAAYYILQEKGPEGLTIRSVADRLNCNSANLYRYFSNLEELALYASLKYLDDYIREVGALSHSGKPILDENGNTTQPYTPQQFADDIVPALSYVDYIGGCCGCDASYIRALRDKLDILGLR